MCGIAGIVSNNEYRIGVNLKKMLSTMEHRGPDGAGIYLGGFVRRSSGLHDLPFEEIDSRIALGHNRLAITSDLNSSTGIQPFQSEDSRLTLLHNGEIYNFRELREQLKGDYHFSTDSDSEVVLRLLEKHYTGDLVSAMKEILPLLDGVYALAVTDNTQTVIARDRIGVRQLYYYANESEVFFSSEKKPIMAFSIDKEDIKRLEPGHLAVMDGKSFNIVQFWSPEYIIKAGHKLNDHAKAMEEYRKKIYEAVKKRIHCRDRVGIIFSGGIDSVLLTYIVQQLGVPFTCYTAGVEGGGDLEWAKKIASELNFPLKIKSLDRSSIRKLIPEIIRDIEDHSLNQVEVAVPIYSSVRVAQENGERVILNGQGADELFGGYPWYAAIVDSEGYESFEKYSWGDTLLLYKECLEREDKIAMAHSIELRVPFLDPKVIETAFSIMPDLKIQKGKDPLQKRIHRELCLSLGIPSDIAMRKKEAAQHGANVHDTITELAGEMEISEKELLAAGYDPDKSVLEKLGSSSRYGYRYGDHHLWKPLPLVQFYLDTHAEKMNLLPKKAQEHWVEVTKKIEKPIIHPKEE